jgi:uncharacterized protein (TIGR02118 family)
MNKIVTLLHKKPGLTDAEFYKYWKEEHGPLAARLIPGLRKYTQSHLVKVPGVECAVDGFAELWFDNLEACQRFLAWRQTNEAKELRDDEDNFLDTRLKRVRYVIEEHHIIP